MTRGRSTWRLMGCVTAAMAVVGGVKEAAGQERGAYQNLHVLPETIARAELNSTMLANLSGLGLPRRANEGCLFCHVGSMEVPSSQWNWASDDNPMKVKARTMMAMVAAINETYLADVERTTQGDVSCYTCHAGRTSPMPLDELLLARYGEGGIDELIEAYRSLRGRYFAADAYDFRTTTLAAVAETLAETGLFEDAARVHGVNIEYSGDPAAHQGLIRMRMTEAFEVGGIDAMLVMYERLRQDHPSEAYSPMLIDPLAWDLFRSGQQQAGFRLFEVNFEEHPDSWVATEDLTYGLESMGDHDRAITVIEAWLEEHPDHAAGLRLLADLRR